MVDMILYALALWALLISSVVDLRIREVPDWVSYALISIALSIRLMFSIISIDSSFILQGLAGFGVMFLLALIMFYTGQWGGGDSKLLMGIGAVFGIPFSLSEFPLLVIFIVNLLFLGAIYGFLWSLFLVVAKFRSFKKELMILWKKRSVRLSMKFVLIFSFSLLTLIFFTQVQFIQVFMFGFAALAMVTFFVALSIKAVENSCMYKLVAPEKLTEGDWIAKEIKVGGRYVCGPKDLGISREQIKELVKLKKRKRIGRVLIKEGIPFVPSFLFAFIATILVGNWLALLI